MTVTVTFTLWLATWWRRTYHASLSLGNTTPRFEVISSSYRVDTGDGDQVAW